MDQMSIFCHKHEIKKRKSWRKFINKDDNYFLYSTQAVLTRSIEDLNIMESIGSVIMTLGVTDKYNHELTTD